MIAGCGEEVLCAADRQARLMLRGVRPAEAVLDTDTFNEMDDQFALVFALLSPELFHLRAVTAAPFFNELSSGPADGMEKSYQEICRILALTGAPQSLAYRGSVSYLPDRDTPVESPAARRIVELAREAKRAGRVLHILAIAALTNVASALLLAPEIAESCVIVWLGGNPPDWPDCGEFNLKQDIAAVQVVFDSGTPLIHIPCVHGAETLLTTLAELEEHCAPFGRIGAGLYEVAKRFMNRQGSRIIWDISTVGIFAAPEAYTSELRPILKLGDDGRWRREPGRPFCRFVCRINRDPVFRILFEKIAAAALADHQGRSGEKVHFPA